MWKEWMKIIVAACFEVVWVVGLTHASSFWEWAVTIVAIIISFYFLIVAGEKLPVGTVYAVFVGLGAAGTVFVDILVFGEEANILKLGLIALLLLGVIGLKLTTDEEGEKS
ncbi:paired small multidrug resistance pump [Gracilibacillus halotolerans]|uniref:Paired small multidrug resistance pump n=1 Tax=Gracilibacillus halotolerans TaxID=74386 RepID=A0A841RNL2_9BACI|nr:SMR family transporter [Gracilibacillus halotolerans]MBB6512765.1 paired small multidrug resistance pump [Gracilibacillus halotolerans]